MKFLWSVLKLFAALAVVVLVLTGMVLLFFGIVTHLGEAFLYISAGIAAIIAIVLGFLFLSSIL